jgi:isopenicillin-N epimerase
MRRHWLLDPDVVFLNHGSFGACPRPVLDAQSRLRDELEREPVLFMMRRLPQLLDAARCELARFVGARPEDLVFVRNATTGVNAVLRSCAFAPGDALLVTDHAYGACRNALDYIAERERLRVDVVRIPLPIAHEGEVVARILACVTPRTKLALIDHVTSQTGLVFPIAQVVAALRERGVETLVDGAHAAGMLELDVERLGAAYYVANLHKWVCAPKGAAMLVVREDCQRALHPLTISHGFRTAGPRARFLEEFDWTGTDDPTAALVVPEAIAFIGGLFSGGWTEARARNRTLALHARDLLSGWLEAPPLAPDSMIGSLASVALPDLVATGPDPLQCALFDRHRLEVPIFPWPASPKRLLRVSAAVYNTSADCQALQRALACELPLLSRARVPV